MSALPRYCVHCAISCVEGEMKVLPKKRGCQCPKARECKHGEGDKIP